MANQVTNRTVNIFIESGQAQRALDALIKKETALKNELAEATNPKHIERLRTEIDRLQEPIDRARKKVSGELSPSFKDVQKTVNDLGNRLKRMSEEDADYSTVLKQYRQASTELDAQRGKVGSLQRAMKSFWAEAKTVAVGVIIGNTIQSAMQTVLGYVTGIVTGSAKISDELSDIEKTTGLTADQVKKVNTELGKIDTRTSQSELRKLATEAGKLGKESVDDIVKFVKEADQIRVALGEDLGDDAVINISKAAGIFKTEMLDIGSAINEIGASSQASERFAVDFLGRMAGVGPTVKLSADQILGYSAALENAQQTSEVAGTALNTFFIEFVRDTEKFGQAAGFAQGELTELLNTKGTNEAFLTFLQRLKESNPDTAQFLKRMQELGIDGARGANVMLALAGNIEAVRTQQGIANKAITEGTSLTEEFNKKNNNAAAELDKFKKNFASLFTSSTFQEGGEAAIRMMNGFINIIKGSFQFIRDHGGLVATLGTIYALATVKIKSLSIGTIAYNTVTSITSVLSKAAGAALIIYRTIVVALTGQITKASAAMMIWRTIMSLGAGPLGVLLVGVGALAIGVQKLLSGTRSLTTEQKAQAEISKRVNDSTSDTISKMQLLTKIASDNRNSIETRRKAIEDLIKLDPEYLKGLTAQNIATAEGTKIINGAITALKAKAEAEAKSALLSENIKKKADILISLRQQTEFEGLDDAAIEKEINKRLEKLRNLPRGTKLSIGDVNLNELIEAQNNIKLLTNDVEKITTAQLSAAAASDTATKSNNDLGESINSLKEKLKLLQEQRDASTNDADRNRLNKEIEETEKRIAALEGKTDKTREKANKAANSLLADLEKIRQSLALATLSPLEKEIGELDIKYGELERRAGNNKKLLLIIDELYQKEKLQLVQRFAREEVAEWSKGQEDISKKAQDQFEKNIKALQNIGKSIADETNKNADVAVDRQDRDRIAERELALINIKGRKKLKAELELLKEQQRQELENADLTEKEKELIEAQYREKRKKAQLDYLKYLYDETTYWLNQLLNFDAAISAIKTQNENNELERDRKTNEKKKSNLDKRLKAGTISQQQYDRELQKMEKDQEKREKEVALRQFKRDQRQKFANALINNAGAVLTTLERFGPPIPPNFLGIAAMALTVGTGIAQLVAISKAKPPEFGGGGLLNGPSHRDKSSGMPVVHPYTGQVQAYLEGGEGIGSKRTMNDQRNYNVSGTPSQIFSLLNGVNGGVQWTTGAKLRPAWSTQRPAQINYAAIHSSLGTVKRYYAGGGVFEDKAPVKSDEGSPENSSELLAVIRDLIIVTNNLAQTLDNIQRNGILGKVGLFDFEKEKERMDTIRDDATMKG